jgi:hypothetical protein
MIKTGFSYQNCLSLKKSGLKRGKTSILNNRIFIEFIASYKVNEHINFTGDFL